MHNKKSCTILDVTVTPITFQDTLRCIADTLKLKKKGYISVSAVHLLMECYKNPKLRHIVNNGLLTVPDGMPLVWLCRHHGFTTERIYGPDLLLKIAAAAPHFQWKIFLLGGARNQSRQVRKVLQKRFPQTQFVGQLDTPDRLRSERSTTEAIALIKKSHANIVFVGTGCPFQEKWMGENSVKFQQPIIFIGVGAAFDFISGRVAQAPVWIRRGGLEWLFRLLQDPKRLWYRYTALNCQFIYLIARKHLRLF